MGHIHLTILSVETDCEIDRICQNEYLYKRKLKKNLLE